MQIFGKALIGEDGSQEAGNCSLRRCCRVSREAYDQVRSDAESGTPVSRANCSAREPLLGVYLAATAMKESA
jgi:hypothetical protein